ncbi:phosphatidylinositol 4-kinase gamma 8-like [Typha latifolia]|uniref:phosphatidylinositol 4-kinase gamma 8-like n=1 Tax=Typha latifolia TaxID=4733 RepID=UPI003C2D0328
MPANSHHHHHRHLSPSPMAVAVDQSHSFKPPLWTRHCRLRSLTHPDHSFLDSSSSSSSPVHRSFSTPCFSSSSSKPDDRPTDQIARVEIVCGRRATGIHALVVEAAIALASGAQPVPAAASLSSTFYLRNRHGESFAVVKPVDDESGTLSRQGSRHSGLREVAAYILDHDGFAGVPPTALIKIPPRAFSDAPQMKSMASIQRFVPHEFDAGELGPSRFSVSSVHRIGILDVRLLNIDRHAGNILVKKHPAVDGYGHDSAAELVPIDHGLCLPEFLDDPYFEWLHWPQSSVPFSESELAYISALDPYKDADLLRSELPWLKESSVRILILCTIFLKTAATVGLCLADIADMMTREFSALEEGPSVLDTLCKKAEDAVTKTEHHLLGSSPPSDRDSEGGEDGNEFQFEMEELSERDADDALDIIPLLLGRKGLEDEVLVSRLGEEGCGGKEEGKVGGMSKSVSFSAAELSYQVGGGGGGSGRMSFKGLSEEEWREFLERFQQLLPEAFEARKCVRLKQRLGTSCKF